LYKAFAVFLQGSNNTYVPTIMSYFCTFE
jgi:hypothetical protein